MHPHPHPTPPPTPQTAKNPLIAAAFSCAGLLDLLASQRLISAGGRLSLGPDQSLGLDFPPQQMELLLPNLSSGLTCVLPSLSLSSPNIPLTVAFLACSDQRRLHAPLADPAPPLEPSHRSSSSSSAGKEGNRRRLIRKSSSARTIVGMFAPLELLSAAAAEGLPSAAHFCCVGPAHASCVMPFGALALSPRSAQGPQRRGHTPAARQRPEAASS